MHEASKRSSGYLRVIDRACIRRERSRREDERWATYCPKFCRRAQHVPPFLPQAPTPTVLLAARSLLPRFLLFFLTGFRLDSALPHIQLFSLPWPPLPVFGVLSFGRRQTVRRLWPPSPLSCRLPSCFSFSLRSRPLRIPASTANTRNGVL